MSWSTSPPNKIEIRIGLAARPRIVEWPVVEVQQAASLVTTPGGPLWMPNSRWLHEGLPLTQHKGCQTAEDCEAVVARVMAFLRALLKDHRDARVPLQRVAAGSTEKSRKVKLIATVMQTGRLPRTLVREKTVPASLLDQEKDGTWTLPRWFVERDILRPGEQVDSLSWRGLSAVEAELRAAATLAQADILKAQQDRAASDARWKEEADQKQAEQVVQAAKQQARDAEMRSMVEQDGEFALAFARGHMTLSDLADEGVRIDRWPLWRPQDGIDADLVGLTGPRGTKAYQVIGPIVEAVRRRADFSVWRERNKARAGALLKPAPAPRARVPDLVIDNCTVEWAEWVGSSNDRRRVDHRQDGCKVGVYGKKHEIVLPDGTIVTKMAGPNLKIFPAAAEQPTEGLKSSAASLPDD